MSTKPVAVNPCTAAGQLSLAEQLRTENTALKAQRDALLELVREIHQELKPGPTGGNDYHDAWQVFGEQLTAAIQQATGDTRLTVPELDERPLIDDMNLVTQVTPEIAVYPLAPVCNGPFGDEEDCPVHGAEIRAARRRNTIHSLDWAFAFCGALKTIPIGNRLALSVNRYDTDDEQVLQLYGEGITYDIRTPLLVTATGDKEKRG